MEFVEETENPVDYCNVAYFTKTVQHHNICVVCISVYGSVQVVNEREQSQL